MASSQGKGTEISMNKRLNGTVSDCWFLVAVTLSAGAIRNGLDIVVGTPGRIIDHMVNGTLDLTQLK